MFHYLGGENDIKRAALKREVETIVNYTFFNITFYVQPKLPKPLFFYRVFMLAFTTAKVKESFHLRIRNPIQKFKPRTLRVS